METQWFFRRVGEKVGPVSAEHIRSLAGSDQISAADLVWKPGMPGWTTAGNVHGLLHEPNAGSAGLGDNSVSPAPVEPPVRQEALQMVKQIAPPPLPLAVSSRGNPASVGTRQSTTASQHQNSILRIGSGFQYGFSGLRSYSGAVLLDADNVYMVVGPNRALGSGHGTHSHSLSSLALELVINAIVGAVGRIIDIRLRHPFAISFRELPDAVRNQQGWEEMTADSQILVIPHSSIESFSISEWLGSSFTIRTSRATFQISSSKEEIQAARSMLSESGQLRRPHSDNAVGPDGSSFTAAMRNGADNPTVSAASPPPGAITIPWYRKNGWVTAMVAAILFLGPFLAVPVLLILSTGPSTADVIQQNGASARRCL